ncbi:MAG: AAA family ATPase [Thiolinea sp.]
MVVLIDEYDKPILDALQLPEVAKANRDFLRGFYGVIKDYDAHIKFSFLTGVSKFSKVSIFSGLNNLYDLSLDRNTPTICGYTDHDIDTVFAAEVGRTGPGRNPDVV